MRIGIICFPSHGGSGALATELGKQLAKLGHKIYFIGSSVPFKLTSWQRNIYYYNVDSIHYPLFEEYNLFPLLLANKIVELVKIKNIEIIHAHYSLPFASSLVMAKTILAKSGIDIQTVVTLHGTDISMFGKDFRIHDVLKYSLEKSDCVTAVCENLSKQAKESLSLSKSPKVIYNFVDIEKDPEEKTRGLHEIFANKNEKIVIHVSNFRNVKRVQDVISIFNNINKKIPAKLLMVGDGPEQRTAQKLAAKYKIIDRVHFLGIQLNISKLLTISNLFLLPSELEAFSLAALEAMACKVPVVASKTGGMGEMIQSGQNGFLADIGDIKTMTDCSIKILSNEVVCKKFIDKAYTRVKTKFSPEAVVPQYENIYHKLIGNK